VKMSTNKLLLLTVIASLTTSVNSVAQPSKYSEFKKKQQQKYQSYKQDYLARYEAYKKDIIEKWGVAELSSNTEYIAYSEDKKVKVVADFENDIVEVNVLNDDDISEEEVSKLVTQTIVDALNATPTEIVKSNAEFAISEAPKEIKAPKPKKPVDKIAKNSVLTHLGVTSEKSLAKVISTLEEVPAKQAKAEMVERTEKRIDKQITALKQFAKKDGLSPQKQQQSIKTIKQLKKEKRKVADKKSELTKKNIKTYRTKLARSRFEKAQQYLTFVDQHAQKWQLEKDVLLAIMETESHFNPLAKSHIPAFGLMQIVPSTAGADVNRKVFSIKNNPTPKQLFNGEQNIKYGSAYVNILMTHYLADVKDPQSRLYCAVAAYNTGIGNLAKAFNGGKRGRKQAIEKINTMTPEQVYQVITKRTHTETQRYLDKVMKSKNYFSQHVSKA